MEKRTLLKIPINEISANPHNPRMIFDRDELEELKNSIKKVGVLVPITVYENTKNYPNTKFILLDGERRWRCAKELGLDAIPANVIDEPEDVTQNILFMFNIHHYRREWELFPTALKLEVIIEKLGTDSEAVLSSFTGVNRSTIRRCKTLLWFPEKYRDILMQKGGKISTDFFIELYPIAYRLSSEEKYSYPNGVEQFVDSMIGRFLQQKTITDVKEFREIRKSMGYYEKVNNFGEFSKRMDKFIENDNVGLEVFASTDEDEDRTRSNILKYIGYLVQNLKEVNPNLISDFYFIDQLESLEKILKDLRERID